MNGTDMLFILAIGFVFLLGVGALVVGIVLENAFLSIIGTFDILLCMVLLVGRAAGIPFFEKNVGKDERVWKMSDRSVRVAYIAVILAMMAMALYELFTEADIQMIHAFYIVISLGTLTYMASYMFQRIMG